jgi:hypothetical protein
LEPGIPELRSALDLTHQHATILRMLYLNACVSRVRLAQLVGSVPTSLSRLRAELYKFDMGIETVKGYGYRLTSGSKEKLDAILENAVEKV